MKWLSKESSNKTPQSSHWKRDKPRLNTLGRHYLTSFHIPEAETGGSETFELYLMGVQQNLLRKPLTFLGSCHCISQEGCCTGESLKGNEISNLSTGKINGFFRNRNGRILLVLFSWIAWCQNFVGLNYLEPKTQITASQWQALQQSINLKNKFSWTNHKTPLNLPYNPVYSWNAKHFASLCKRVGFSSLCDKWVWNKIYVLTPNCAFPNIPVKGSDPWGNWPMMREVKSGSYETMMQMMLHNKI